MASNTDDLYNDVLCWFYVYKPINHKPSICGIMIIKKFTQINKVEDAPAATNKNIYFYSEIEITSSIFGKNFGKNDRFIKNFIRTPFFENTYQFSVRVTRFIEDNDNEIKVPFHVFFSDNEKDLTIFLSALIDGDFNLKFLEHTTTGNEVNLLSKATSKLLEILKNETK